MHCVEEDAKVVISNHNLQLLTPYKCTEMAQESYVNDHDVSFGHTYSHAHRGTEVACNINQPLQPLRR